MDEKDNCVEIDESTPKGRVIIEKRALDIKIEKLYAMINKFKDDRGSIKYDELCQLVGSGEAADALLDQLDIMIRYSSILNTRILLWKD